MNEKKRAEEEQKQMADLTATTPEPVAAPAAGKKKSTHEISFGAAPPRFMGTQAGQFPTLEEADKMKLCPKKPRQEHKEASPIEKPSAEFSSSSSMPRFTNTRKKNESPKFSKLDQDPKRTYEEKAPRDFEVSSQ